MVIVVALQVIVPVIAFLPAPPQRFSFQMYSARGGIEVVVIDEDGEQRPFDAEPLVGQLRPEIDWSRTLPERVCAAEDGVAAVKITQFERERIVECA
ncbi:hypothetical protein [Agromyces sp. SYSU T00266]|uniref:hypothetical protein n=1 Tax=Agromyces zhanjiangensis TaxID=3158562 RepID=UPI00339B1118